MTIAPSVTHNTAARQFEIETDAGLALLRYVRRGDQLDLVHTEVPSALEGQGYGSSLARAALDFARSEGLKVIPSCPFVRGYLKEHTENADLVATA
jgi:predicted GNAT family acetyltransferase